jgi:hypothetical protein
VFTKQKAMVLIVATVLFSLCDDETPRIYGSERTLRHLERQDG